MNKATTAAKVDHHPRRRMTFDAAAMRARVEGNMLVLEVPQVPLSGPLVTQEMRQEMLDHAGLTPFEVDALIDSWYDEIANRSFAKWLLKQQVRE